LQKADLVIATRIGKWTYYRRNEETIAELAKLVETEL
jgi:transcriptional regulator, ArsR family